MRRSPGTSSEWDYCGAGHWIRHGGWIVGGAEGHAAEVFVRDREPFTVRVRQPDGMWLPDVLVRGRGMAFKVADALMNSLGWTCDDERNDMHTFATIVEGVGRVTVHHNSDYSGMAIVQWGRWSVEIPAGILLAAAQAEVTSLREELEAQCGPDSTETP